jgi:phosphoribosylglycinamide formyltransferase-1
MSERFISEAIQPSVETYDTARMATGEPGLPREFTWRGQTIVVAGVLRTWRDTGKCRNGSPELYVRKHWFEISTTGGDTMKIYFDRQPRGGRHGARWWLFSLSEKEEAPASSLARLTVIDKQSKSGHVVMENKEQITQRRKN